MRIKEAPGLVHRRKCAQTTHESGTPGCGTGIDSLVEPEDQVEGLAGYSTYHILSPPEIYHVRPTE